MFGVVEIDGVKYIERYQAFPVDVVIVAANQILLNQSVVLPGVAPFLLKKLTRSIDAAGVVAARLFRFKFGNTDGGIYYTSAGLGGANDRVFDASMFGTGQFPFFLVPPIWYGANANIIYELEDVAAVGVPYNIRLTFHGSYLIPA